MKSVRSPIKRPPLQRGGDSLHERLLDVAFGQAMWWFIAATLFTMLALMEWMRFFVDSTPHPALWSAVALPVILIAIVKIPRALSRVRKLKLGRDGERSVAESLDALIAEGWRVFHDIPATGFNVDHVAIGPKGILAIETKTRSKPTDRDAQIVVSDDGVSLDGGPWDMTDMVQAERQAAWLRKFLRENTATEFFVRPVLLFPGWYVNQNRSRKDTWVLNPGQVGRWLDFEDDRLPKKEIALAASRLDSYLRASR